MDIVTMDLTTGETKRRPMTAEEVAEQEARAAAEEARVEEEQAAQAERAQAEQEWLAAIDSATTLEQLKSVLKGNGLATRAATRPTGPPPK